VYSPTGSSCWVWRDIWNHLADGGNIDDAAATIGAIAGIGPNEPPTGPQFADPATQFLDRVGSRGWSDCHRSEDLETVSASFLALLRCSIEGRGSSRLDVGARSDRFGEFIESCRRAYAPLPRSTNSSQQSDRLNDTPPVGRAP
jgi:hypothetical protein